MLTRGAVFARMSPGQKQLLVEELQKLGYYVGEFYFTEDPINTEMKVCAGVLDFQNFGLLKVLLVSGMCGDGANDCGALKAANAGISLSDAESSVASPFTSKHPNISCVPMLIREGRTALVTSFGIFKYVACYSLIQFISVIVLYSIDSDLTDIQFLYIDLFMITTIVFFFGKTESYEGPLTKKTPLASLVSFSPILSLFLQMTLVIAIQVAAFHHVAKQDWFVSFEDLHRAKENSSESAANITAVEGEIGERSCYENYAVFGVSSLQYIILAIVFSKGKPYRKSLFANHGLLISLIVLTAFTVYLIFEPSDWMKSSFELIVPPDHGFRATILVYGLVNFVIACFIEYFIVDYVAFKKLRYRFHRVEKSKKKYLAIEKKMKYDLAWPVISKDRLSEPDTMLQENVETPVEETPTKVKETKFQRPNFEFGDLPSINNFDGSRFGKKGDGRVRRYSENSNNNVGNEFLKMSVPNLPLMNGFLPGIERSGDDLS